MIPGDDETVIRVRRRIVPPSSLLLNRFAREILFWCFILKGQGKLITFFAGSVFDRINKLVHLRNQDAIDVVVRNLVKLEEPEWVNFDVDEMFIKNQVSCTISFNFFFIRVYDLCSFIFE